MVLIFHPEVDQSLSVAVAASIVAMQDLFIAPNAYPQALWHGHRFTARECTVEILRVHKLSVQF